MVYLYTKVVNFKQMKLPTLIRTNKNKKRPEKRPLLLEKKMKLAVVGSINADISVTAERIPQKGEL